MTDLQKIQKIIIALREIQQKYVSYDCHAMEYGVYNSLFSALENLGFTTIFLEEGQ